MGSNGKRYTQEFKDGVIRMILEDGRVFIGQFTFHGQDITPGIIEVLGGNVSFFVGEVEGIAPVVEVIEVGIVAVGDADQFSIEVVAVPSGLCS